MLKKYKKKPVVIEAIQLNGSSVDEIREWGGVKVGYYHSTTGTLYINTLEGSMTASNGDYIIKGVQGEIYPCKPDIFQQTYEEV